MNVLFHRLAAKELVNQRAYYRQRVATLGDDFFLAVETAVKAILSEPHRIRAAVLGLSRIRVRRFPFNVLFHMDASTIRIYAITHAKRRPGYWRGRLSKD